MEQCELTSLRYPRWMPADYDPHSLAPLEVMVMGALLSHSGRQAAITVGDISIVTMLSDRTVRAILKHLTEKRGIGIVTGCTGCYLVETAAELEEYLDNLKKRALSTLRRMAVLARKHLPELLGQLRIEVGEL